MILENKYIDPKNLWTEMTRQQKIDFLFSKSYPGYFISDIGMIYQLTGNIYYKNISLDAFDIVLDDFRYNGRILNYSYNNNYNWYRDSFARNSFLFYMSFIYLQEEYILKEIEQQVQLWLNTVARDWDDGFLVFPFGVDEDDNLLSYNCVPNQNFELALLFSYLYWDNKSIYYKELLFKEIVESEVNYALSFQNPDGSLEKTG